MGYTGDDMANRLVVPETRVCPICGTAFLVGGRGRRPRRTIYCSRSCQNANRQRINPHIGSHAPRPRKNVDTVHNPAWLHARYHGDGLSTSQIAQLVACSTPTIKWAMNKYGIQTRTSAEGRRLQAPPRADHAAMVAAYGGKCACCGETETRFLSLDHVNGGGARHRREVGNSYTLFRQLRDAGWPTDGYRVLCMNCQFGTRNGRTCPHQPTG